MRHLLSLLLGLVLAPLIYIAAGFSAVKFASTDAAGNIQLGPAAIGLVAALVAGGLYALLVMARLSPLGPVLAGLAYLGVTIWALLDRTGFLSALPKQLLGATGVLQTPVGFGTTLLAVPLLVTIFSPRRWRRYAQPQPVSFQAAPVYSPNAPVDPAAPTYSPPTFASPTYEPSVYTPTTSAYSPTSAAPSYAPLQASDYAAPTYVSPNDPPTVAS